MATTIQRIVGQLHFVEQHRLGRPVRAQSRTVRMQVHALRTLRFGSASRHPLRAGEFVSAVTSRHHLQQDTVVGVILETSQSDAQRGEHATVRGERANNKLEINWVG